VLIIAPGSPNPTTPTPEAELSPTDAARAARRAVLDFICDANVRAAETLTGYINGDIAEDRMAPFQRLQDPFLALTRVTRAIQQTVLLQERLDEDDEVREKRLAAEKAAREREIRARRTQAEAEEERHAVALRKYQVERALERAIDANVTGVENTNCHVDMCMRLGDLERFEDLTAGPVSAIVERLCRDLYLPYDPELWEDEPWAIEEAAAAEALIDQDAPASGADHALVAAVRPQAVANGHDPP